MQTGGSREIARWLQFTVPVLFFMAAAVVPTPAGAALLKGAYNIEWDQDVSKTSQATTDVRTLKQSVELRYSGFVSPVMSTDLSFKIEQEISSNAADIIRILPQIDLGLKGRVWDVKAGGKRTHENSDDPATTPKVTDSYNLEFNYSPPKRVPDLKAKYTLDTDFQDGVTDSRKQGFNISSIYTPNNWLNIKGDFTKDRSDDKLNADSDSVDQKRSASVEIRRIVSDRIKLDLRYSVEETRGATIIDAGGFTNEKNDESHSIKSSLGFRPFTTTSVDGAYDFDLKENMVNGEHTLTTNRKATLDQKILKFVALTGDLSQTITETRHSLDDNRKTEETQTLEAKTKITAISDISLKYQDKNTDEDHFADPTKNKTSRTLNRNATWSGALAPFWAASASYDKTDTFENEARTVVDTKYSLKSTFDFKTIALNVEPTYDITLKDDAIAAAKTATRDFKVKVTYTLLRTGNIVAKLDHTYGRKTDTAARNIQRSDSTNGTATWENPFPGWMFGFDVTRSATDTSGDDLPPDISSTFAFKADYKYRFLNLNLSYKYDKKSLSDNSETFDAKAGWAGKNWDASLTYSFNKTFSALLDEGYAISLVFKYNL